MSWLKQNWFRLAILLILVGTSIGFFTVFPKENIAPTLQTIEPASSPTPLTSNVLQKIAPAPVDPTIKLETCKTQAKNYADKIAKRVYLLAVEKAIAEGDTKTAQIYLEASYKPEHPADYDSNYSAEYINCLKQ